MLPSQLFTDDCCGGGRVCSCGGPRTGTDNFLDATPPQYKSAPPFPKLGRYVHGDACGRNQYCGRSCGACWQVRMQSGYFHRWDKVQIRGLRFEALNEVQGVLCCFSVATGRWFVILSSGIGLAVPLHNLVIHERHLRGHSIALQRSADHLRAYHSWKSDDVPAVGCVNMHRLGVCYCPACLDIGFHHVQGDPEPDIIINDLCTESQQCICYERERRGPLGEKQTLSRLQSLAQRFKVEGLPVCYGDEITVFAGIELRIFRTWRRYCEQKMHWARAFGCPGRSSRCLRVGAQEKHTLSTCLETDAIKYDRCTKAQLQILFLRTRKTRGRVSEQLVLDARNNS